MYKGKPDIYRGDVVTPAGVGYVKGLLAIDAKDKVKLMRYAFDYLDHKDQTVATDAYHEFVTAGDPDIRTAAKGLAPEKLRGWLRDEKTPATRLRLYGYLLGNCGTKADAALLRKLLDRLTRHEDGSPVCDGILTGYTLLDPKEGWAYARELFKRPNADFIGRYSALRAARYFHTTHPGVLTQKDILGVVSLALEQPDMADLPVNDLRQWKCWELTDAVLALFDNKDFDIPIVRRNVVRYALQCPDPKATRFVAELRKKDPDLVAAAEEYLRQEKPPTP
jgi:hypothetical protein